MLVNDLDNTLREHMGREESEMKVDDQRGRNHRYYPRSKTTSQDCLRRKACV